MNASSMGSYIVVEEAMSGIHLGVGSFASDSSDSWENYEPVNDPASGQKLNPGKFASDSADSWENYEPVNDPASGQKLNPGKFASDSSDSWENYEPVNDPASGQKLNPGKFATDAMTEDTWETFDPHGASAPTPAEVEGMTNTPASREAANSSTGNAIFDSLWTQALQIAPLPLAVFGCGAASLCCAVSKDGKKAIKITTAHGCKVLVCAQGEGDAETAKLNIRLVGGAMVPALVSENGEISFAIPVETNRLIELVKRIEKWTVSFMILYGRMKAGVVVSSVA